MRKFERTVYTAGNSTVLALPVEAGFIKGDKVIVEVGDKLVVVVRKCD